MTTTHVLDGTANPMAQLIRSLAHPSTDPPTLVTRVRHALGWEGSDFLVSLQGYGELMETLEVAVDLDALVRIGDPTSPPLRLLRAINASTTGLRVTRMATVASPWRWVRVGEGAAELAGVALRQQAYADVVGALGRAGLTFRVLADDTPTEQVLAVGRELGSAVVDVDEVDTAADTVAVDGYLDDQDPLTYGLVSREDRPADVASEVASEVDVVWLSMRAPRESAGTLMQALEQFSSLGLNLDFLHSDPREPDQHDFYLGFRSDADNVAALQAALAEVHFTSRVLASFALPGNAGSPRQPQRPRVVSAPAVAYLGPSGTFTHQAVLALRPDGDAVPVGSQAEALAMVEAGSAAYAVLPIDNSVNGVVVPTLDGLLERPSLSIVDSAVVAISFAAFTRDPGVPPQVVVSHPHALAQCRAWIEARGLPTREALSTAAACRDLVPGEIGIGPAICGALYDLEVVESAVEDHVAAFTQFALVAADSTSALPGEGDGDDGLLVSILPDANVPGLLRRLLGVLEDRDINMTNLVTRPVPARPGIFEFLLFLAGHFTADDFTAMRDEWATLGGTARAIGRISPLADLMHGPTRQ